ncbi:MAG: Gfo/Idh/MocA family oxidoreductase [Synechococcales cyanobacterium M58_A2018_015]|nr:Gfo/Idh/MocA family oxidoreductase [Synechococcales cyanobacterium M58_A2018_015]
MESTRLALSSSLSARNNQPFVQPVQPQSQLLKTDPDPHPVKVALLGVGRWGTHWLRNLLVHPQAELMAVVDPAEERLHSLARQHSWSQSLLLTPDWATALQLSGLEAVVVATPAATHYSLIRSALERGLHVLAEKPLTLRVAESQELCQLAAQQQRQLVIDHTYLFHPAVQRGKAVMQQGSLGDLRYGYATRTHLGPVRHDVDALWDLAIHDIAIFNHWLAATPVTVQAQGSVWLQQNHRDSDLFQQGLSDLVWVKLTYASGFQAVIHLCWANPDKQRRLCLVGSQGTLIFDELAAQPLTLWHGRLEPINQQFVPLDQCQRVLDLENLEPLQRVCTHFLDCARHNRPSDISPGSLGAELVKILTALSQSLNQGGQPVSI